MVRIVDWATLPMESIIKARTGATEPIYNKTFVTFVHK